jgi:hypothetical protein
MPEMSIGTSVNSGSTVPRGEFRIQDTLVLYSNGSQPLSDRGPVNSLFYKTKARYNWCQGPVLGRGPAVENTAVQS